MCIRDRSWHFTFAGRGTTFTTVSYHNALSFLSLQCREKKEKESEPKLRPADQIQSAAIHQYTIIAHTHDCSYAKQTCEPYPQCAEAHIAMSPNWAQVRVRNERKMGENTASASSKHACATQPVVTTPLKQPSGTAAI